MILRIYISFHVLVRLDCRPSPPVTGKPTNYFVEFCMDQYQSVENIVAILVEFWN